MEVEQLSFVLQALAFSSDLPAGVLRQIAAICQLREVRAGEIVFREGSRAAELFLIEQGHIALEMAVPGRGSCRILTLGPGDVLGWSALLGDGTMTATAIAVDAARLLVAPADQLRKLCEGDHELGYHVMRRMAHALARRLVATRLQLLDLFSQEPPPLSPQRPGASAT